MFDKYKKDISKIVVNYRCDIFTIPKNQTENKIYIYGSKKKLDNIQPEVENIIKKAKQSLQVYVINSTLGSMSDDEAASCLKEINNYVNVGRMINETPQVQRIQKLIQSIYSNESPFEQKPAGVVFSYEDLEMYPFIFVGASSGTGKTQLPFALDIPVLYFLYHVDDDTNTDVAEGSSSLSRSDEELGESQQIYQYFGNLSKCFNECIDKDFEEFKIQNKKQRMNTRKFIKNNYSTFKSETVAFIISLYKMMVDDRKHNSNEHWLISELRAGGERIKSMTMSDAQIEIEKLFGNDSKNRPVIFIDESSISTENNKESIERYKLIRAILRTIFIPIFMGTNASVINFVGSSGAMKDSRDKNMPTIPWCYAIYELSPFSTKKLKEEKEKLLMDCRLEPDDSRMRFINFVYSRLEYERPLFCNYIIDYLYDNRTNILNSSSFDPMELMNEILLMVFTKFTSAKRTFSRSLHHNFYAYDYMQLSYMLSQLLHDSQEKQEYMSRCNDDSRSHPLAGVPIHQHLGYLLVSDKIREKHPTYIGLMPDKMKMGYLEIIGASTLASSTYRYGIFHTYPKFEKETFAALAFFGPATHNWAFIDKIDNKVVRISTSRAMYNFHSEDIDIRQKQKSIIDITAPSLDGRVFEIVNSLSMIVASHGNGFRGSTFGQWLEALVQELDFNACWNLDESAHPMIEYPDNAHEMMSAHIPFCAPMLNAKWDKPVAEYLESIDGCVGTVSGDLGGESRDVFMKMNGALVVSAECKFWNKSIGNNIIAEIIDKLSTFRSRINLIFVAEFIEAIKIDNCTLYLLEKESTQKYRLKQLNSGSKSKCFILISIKTILEHGNADSGYSIGLEDIKSLFR